MGVGGGGGLGMRLVEWNVDWGYSKQQLKVLLRGWVLGKLDQQLT